MQFEVLITLETKLRSIIQRSSKKYNIEDKILNLKNYQKNFYIYDKL